MLAVWMALGASCVAQQVLTTVTDPNGRAPRDVAVNPVTNRIYVINQASDNVTVIDGAMARKGHKVSKDQQGHKD